jgi:hypothetical protein
MCNLCKKVLARQALRVFGKRVKDSQLQAIFPPCKPCPNVKRGVGYIRIRPTQSNCINALCDLNHYNLL